MKPQTRIIFLLIEKPQKCLHLTLPFPQLKISSRLMIRRVTAMSDSLLDFSSLSPAGRAAALRSNADLMVSLRAAVFFEEKKRGLEQVGGGSNVVFRKKSCLVYYFFPAFLAKGAKIEQII